MCDTRIFNYAEPLLISSYTYLMDYCMFNFGDIAADGIKHIESGISHASNPSQAILGQLESREVIRKP